MSLCKKKTDFLWQILDEQSRSFEKSMDPLHRKQTGSYYTSLELTYAMMKELVFTFSEVDRKRLYLKTFFEPCVGTGNFVFAYLRVCKELSFSYEENVLMLNNIYVCDINKKALEHYKKYLSFVAKEWFEITLDDKYFDTHIGNGLLFDVDSVPVEYISIDKVFELNFNKGFDIVATNPPYKNLKAEHTHYDNISQKEKDKQKYSEISKLASSYFDYSTYGTLNLYKLFVEEIVERYVSKDGVCSLLIPSSILSDKSCAKLRTRLLNTCAIESIRLIPESSEFVNSAQALCTILLKKGRQTNKILVDGSFNNENLDGSYADIKDIIDESTGNAILVLSKNEYYIRNIMKKHPTIKNISYIINQRGELDITLNKLEITLQKTPYKLFRGRHIGFYKTFDLPTIEYVSERFVNETAKQKFIHQKRLACQQIANMAKKRRIAFGLVSEESVLGNSCNFISVAPNDDGVDIYFLMGILNSTLIDWFFKLTSSNNHINNYEIDAFPIPINYTKKNEIADLVKSYLITHNEELIPRIDEMVYDAYGVSNNDSLYKKQQFESKQSIALFNDVESLKQSLHHDFSCIVPNISYDESINILNEVSSINELCFIKKPNATNFEIKVLENIERKYRQLYKGRILNHTTFKLSDLDLEMIRPIPQGGSWKDIPYETVQKSKRLQRITKTGGRTTLYGRIDYSKPSYTITTYFNRPGNGTYIHPIHNRVLSVREAARFQTFSDSYMFCGNKTDMLKQVGNAVPVVLAYSIAKSIKEKIGCCSSVDLFSGAGGMTYGFKLAGINAAIANDFDESACTTLKTNNPEIPVICGDITDSSIKESIITAAKTNNADIICGGPPCQGFSLAGYRMKDDPRNQLFRHFVDIVSKVKPKVIVFENVEGLLSFENGETYKNIIQLFSELGYNTEGRKLLANNYGVPQRRKRVIILCTRKDIAVLPSDIFPTMITPNIDRQPNAYNTLYDLEKIACGDDAEYDSEYNSPLLSFLKGYITPDEYLEKIFDDRGIIETAESSVFAEKNPIVKNTKANKNVDSNQMSLFDMFNEH